MIKWSDLQVFVLQKNTENQFWPKCPKNFFESGGFAIGRLGYLKHEYYFPLPIYAISNRCVNLLDIEYILLSQLNFMKG